MHILEIPSFFPPLGGEFCIEQSKALQARGHEVRIIACNQLGVSVNPKSFFTARLGMWEETIDGITVLRRNMHGVPKVVGYNRKTWCRTVMKMYHEYVKRYGRPDILHAHCCKWAGVAASMISEREGIPFVITEHLSSTLFMKDFGENWEKHVWAKKLLKETYKKANCVVPVSAELVDNLAPFFDRDYRWKSVSNIIDADFFTYRERKPSGNYKFCCLAVSNIFVKGYDVLADAWKDMQGAELHIAGRGTTKEDIVSLFKDCRNVVFHGELDKAGVRQLLYDCDALVLASRSEAQGLVILEALSTGIPVVTTDIVPRNAIVEEACLIAHAGSASDLKAKMTECINRQSSPLFSEQVRLIASPESIGKQIEEVLRSVADHR